MMGSTIFKTDIVLCQIPTNLIQINSSVKMFVSSSTFQDDFNCISSLKSITMSRREGEGVGWGWGGGGLEAESTPSDFSRINQKQSKISA